jgi:formylmethanofuran dehydrogenase subunit A
MYCKYIEHTDKQDRSKVDGKKVNTGTEAQTAQQRRTAERDNRHPGHTDKQTGHTVKENTYRQETYASMTWAQQNTLTGRTYAQLQPARTKVLAGHSHRQNTL